MIIINYIVYIIMRGIKGGLIYLYLGENISCDIRIQNCSQKNNVLEENNIIRILIGIFFMGNSFC